MFRLLLTKKAVFSTLVLAGAGTVGVVIYALKGGAEVPTSVKSNKLSDSDLSNRAQRHITEIGDIDPMGGL